MKDEACGKISNENSIKYKKMIMKYKTLSL